MSESILEQFLEIRDRLLKEGHEPVRVIFSPHGHMKALMENQHSDNNPFETYMGLPFTIRSDMPGEIGLDYQFEDRRRDAVTVKLGFNARTGHVLVDGKPFGEPIHLVQLVGSKLTQVQLCDLMQGYLDRTGHKPLSDFDRSLAMFLKRHGRFE